MSKLKVHSGAVKIKNYWFRIKKKKANKESYPDQNEDKEKAT